MPVYQQMKNAEDKKKLMTLRHRSYGFETHGHSYPKGNDLNFVN